MRRSSSFCFLLIVASSFVQAQANKAEVCNAALAKDIATTFVSQQQDLDFISVVDQTTFNEAKQKGSFGVSIPLADDLLQLSGKWEDFRTNRSTYFKQVNYQTHTKATDFRHFETSSPLAYQAWQTCIMAFSHQETGLFAWKEREDKDNIVVRIAFHQIGKILPVPLTVKVKRGSEAEQTIPTQYKMLFNEQVATIVIPRSSVPGSTKPSDLIATFKAGMFSDFIYSSWVEPVPPPVFTSETVPLETPCMVPRGNMTNDAKDLIGAYCNAPAQITGVRFDKCVNTSGDDVCGHTWYTGHANVLPGGTQVNAQFYTNNGNPAGLFYLTIFSSVSTKKCTGIACKTFKSPSEVLANCPNGICKVS